MSIDTTQQQVMSPTGTTQAGGNLTEKEKLNSTNYLTWAFKMECILVERGLWNHISGQAYSLEDEVIIKEEGHVTLAESAQAADKRKKEKMRVWSARDATVRAILGRNVSDGQLHIIRKAGTAGYAWNKLKELHRSETATYKRIGIVQIGGKWRLRKLSQHNYSNHGQYERN